MTQYVVVKCPLQLLTASGEVLKLSTCIVVKFGTIGGCKVTEYRARLYYIPVSSFMCTG